MAVVLLNVILLSVIPFCCSVFCSARCYSADNCLLVVILLNAIPLCCSAMFHSAECHSIMLFCYVPFC
jgi:hypothetical protein